ncbi:HAD family hydrolase [Flavobacterium faecale]|uniref:phosphoglycolate phosphatase n=1 Tax=Flavobacterium faecale TaxID=1355330 RepID=A0A2S1LHY9_9FLAO|nr:HAD family hydrolase [Flavobacterium faecale]AWG23405.1 HAD family hydrolase [Flavobacterium faecale]
MTYKAVIFDLDGTLVNSLSDIATATNTVLANNNFPTHDDQAYNFFVGSGLRTSVARALPAHAQTETEIDRCYDEMMLIYNRDCTLTTKPYSGIISLLDQLKAKGIKLAVLSNKADALTKKIAGEIFPDYFEIIQGLTTEEFKKPNPVVALQMAAQLGVQPNEVLYVGDSGVDMETAVNAQFHAVGVLWGFRPKEELLATGAQTLLHNAEELLELL